MMDGMMKGFEGGAGRRARAPREPEGEPDLDAAAASGRSAGLVTGSLAALNGREFLGWVAAAGGGLQRRLEVEGMSAWRGMALFLGICAILVILILIGLPFLGRGLAIGALLLILVLLCPVLMFRMMRNMRDDDRGGPRQNGKDR